MDNVILSDKYAKTKRRIIRAFIHLMQHTDFESITVKKICDEAEISRGSFYNHFKDKYDVRVSRLLDVVQDMPSFISIQEGQANKDTFKKLVEAYILSYKEIDYDMNRQTRQSELNGEFSHIINTITESLIDKLKEDPNANKEQIQYIKIASQFYMAGLLYSYGWYKKNNKDISAEKFLETLLNII